MLQMTDRMGFGKWKGASVSTILCDNPSYLSWLMRTGFSDFGKEVTLAIHQWEDENPYEVKKIEARIAEKKRLSGGVAFAERAASGKVPVEAFVPLQQSRDSSTFKNSDSPEWGSW